MDTIRLRALHTKCLTVRQIAKIMGEKPSTVEKTLKTMGYKPRYKAEFEKEQDKLLSEIRKEPAQAGTHASSKGKE